MSARCPVCKRFIRAGAYCAATPECGRNTARRIEQERADQTHLHRLDWSAHVRSRLRDLTPEQRDAIRAWVDLLAEAPEGGAEECLRALDEVGL